MLFFKIMTPFILFRPYVLQDLSFPNQVIESMTWAEKVQSLNHWTAREFPIIFKFFSSSFSPHPLECVTNQKETEELYNHF